MNPLRQWLKVTLMLFCTVNSRQEDALAEVEVFISGNFTHGQPAARALFSNFLKQIASEWPLYWMQLQVTISKDNRSCALLPFKLGKNYDELKRRAEYLNTFGFSTISSCHQPVASTVETVRNRWTQTWTPLVVIEFVEHVTQSDDNETICSTNDIINECGSVLELIKDAPSQSVAVFRIHHQHSSNRETVNICDCSSKRCSALNQAADVADLVAKWSLGKIRDKLTRCRFLTTNLCAMEGQIVAENVVITPSNQTGRDVLCPRSGRRICRLGKKSQKLLLESFAEDRWRFPAQLRKIPSDVFLFGKDGKNRVDDDAQLMKRRDIRSKRLGSYVADTGGMESIDEQHLRDDIVSRRGDSKSIRRRTPGGQVAKTGRNYVGMGGDGGNEGGGMGMNKEMIRVRTFVATLETTPASISSNSRRMGGGVLVTYGAIDPSLVPTPLADGSNATAASEQMFSNATETDGVNQSRNGTIERNDFNSSGCCASSKKGRLYFPWLLPVFITCCVGLLLAVVAHKYIDWTEDKEAALAELYFKEKDKITSSDLVETSD